jgi:hypothetical protein
MQFNIDVLPAPFGPIIENNSPFCTEKLTSLNARTPPKTSDTSLMLKIGSDDVIVLVSSLTWAAFICCSARIEPGKMNRPNFSVSLICVCYFYPAGRYRKGRNAINTYLSTKFTQ